MTTPQPGSAPAPPPASAAPPLAQTPPLAAPAESPGETAAPGTEAPPSGGAESAAEPDNTVKPGDQTADATARYGDGSRRNGYLREAAGWDIHGDYVRGSKEYFQGVKNFFYQSGTRERAVSELSSRLAGLIEKAFVSPDCLPEMQAAFAKSRVVILRGPDGYGKSAIAIHLLLESHAAPLFRVDEWADLARLREWFGAGDAEHRHIPAGAGFILDHPLDAAHLRGSVLEAFEEALEHADARLVLTARPEAAVADGLRDYVIDVTSAPDCEKIVESHLRYLGARTAVIVLAREDVRVFIREQLGASPTCQIAAELATDIADYAAIHGAESLDLDDIGKSRSQRGTVTVDNWFSELKETQTRCFAVALAVLNRSPYDTVAKAARALYRRFIAAPFTTMASGGEPALGSQGPFLPSRQKWLNSLQARVKESAAEPSRGHGYAEIVEYKKERYPQQIIRLAWSDYRAQDKFIAWLGELAQDQQEQVRIIAGKTLGLLALWSFGHISLTVLESWAAGTRRQREAVAYALMVVARDGDRHRDGVRDLVSGWYADARKPLAQATAARAYGLVRGAIDRDEAFAALCKLAMVDDIRVAIAVGDAIVDMLDDGTEAFACSVLDTLASYIDDRKRSAAAQLVFLIAAANLTVPVRAEGQGPETSWPFLLHLASTQPPARTALVRLWRRVLNGSEFVDESAQVMTEWASATEEDVAAQQAFLRLVRAIAEGDERSRMIFGRYAAVWSSDDNFNPILKTSAAIQALLETERMPR